MSITINESQIQAWIQDGIKRALEDALRSSYGLGGQLKAPMQRAISEAEPEILKALKEGISKACISPEFIKGIEREIAASLANQYRGAFEGVIRAAAKQAASTEVVARRVIELTKRAAENG